MREQNLASQCSPLEYGGNPRSNRCGGVKMGSILKFLNFLRRNFMKLVDKNYVEKKLSRRKGKCRRCGKCCEGCKFLNKQKKLCSVYNNRPKILCHNDFPLDELDKKIWKIKRCGYSFGV